MRVFLLMIAHVVLAGCGYIVVKLGLREFGPFAFAFYRLAIGLLAISAVVFHKSWWPKLEKKDWPRLIVLALLAVPINQVVYIFGMQYSVPSHASILYGLTAAFALTLSAILGYEKLRAHKVLAILICLCGILLVVWQHNVPDPDSELLRGDLLVLTAVIAWAVYTVLAKPLVIKYGAIPATMASLLVGTLAALPFLIPAAIAQDYSKVTWIGWGAVFYSGVFLTVLAYSVWFTLVKMIDPSQVAILTTPQPIVATSLSALILGEVVGWRLVAGGVLVISGILMMDAPAFISKFNRNGNSARVK